MNVKSIVAAAALCGSLIVAGPGQAAAIVGLFNTGVDATGTSTLSDGSADLHYTTNGGGAAYLYTHPAYLTDPDAKFISDQADGGYGQNPTTYSLFFDLTGLMASTAQLSGKFASDNYASVYLNTTLLATDLQFTTEANFKNLTSFSAGPVAFLSGVNELRFVVTDTGAPGALLVTDLVGTAAAVPEPATWAMMIIGFGAMGSAIRSTRRRRFAATEH